MQGLSLHNYTVVDWDKKFASVGFGDSSTRKNIRRSFDSENTFLST